MRTFSILFLCAILSGCATLDPGQDALVVRAEQTSSIAFETMNEFLLFYERSDIQTQRRLNSTAVQVSTHGKTALLALRGATKIYKQSKAAEDRTNLETALLTVSQILTAIQKQLPANP